MMQNKPKKSKRPMSIIMVFHYMKLVFRSLLFIGALLMYIVGWSQGENAPLREVRDWPILLNIIWLVFIVEMVLRFFPSHVESMGCQKQFRMNYIPVSASDGKPHLQSWKTTFLVTVLWLGLNAVFAALYYTGIFDAGIMLLIALAYSVCDMICILFFCPFQTWFMKNKCCGTCRIYNWDYAMMFTPLVFVPMFYTWSLALCAILLLIRWEVTVRRHPERFSENTNASLECRNCREKLCHHKTQLRQVWKKNKIRTMLSERR